MKIFKGIICAFFGLTGLAAAAQQGNIISQDRFPGEFTSIECSGQARYFLSTGNANVVRVEAPAEVMDKIKTEVKNDVLTFQSEGSGTGNLTFFITATEVHSIKISDAAVLEGKNPIKTRELKVEAGGAGEATLEIEVDKLTTDVSGAANLFLKGEAENHRSTVSGAASLKAEDLKTVTAHIDVSGAGDARIDATGSLSGEVSGAGNLFNKSNPADIDLDASGAGSVQADTTHFRFGDKRVMIYNRECPNSGERHHGAYPFQTKYGVRPQWLGLEIGVNGYVNKEFGFEPPAGYVFFEPDYGRSFSVGLNIFEWGVPLVKKHMNLVTGIGFEYNNYFFRNNYRLLSDTTMLTGLDTYGPKFEKNKLSVSWLRIPLLLQFDSKQNAMGGSFHFSMGVIGAIKMNSFTKQVWVYEDSKSRIKTRDDFNLSPFKADATVRIGYGYLNLFVNYSLTDMFRKGEGPRLNPVSAGITLLNF